MTFDDVIDSLGGFGHWQRVIYVLLSSFDIYAAFAMMIPVFTGSVPDWYCERFSGSNVTYNESQTWKTCELQENKCEVFKFIDSFTSIVSEWDLVCDRDYLSDLITTCQGVGLMLGAAAFAQLSDMVGRKPSFFFANCIMLLAGFVSAFVPSWQWYAFVRLLVGFGFGANMVVACVYPIEFIGRQWRVFCGTFGFWSIGVMALALLAYLIRDWKTLTMISSITGVIFYVTFIIVPESPRWMNLNNRHEEAKAVLTTIAKKNKKPLPDLTQLMRASQHDADQRSKTKRYTYLDLFKTRVYFKQTVILVFTWFTSFVLYYMLSFNMKNLSGDRYLNMLYSGMVDLLAQLSPVIFLTVLGRKRALMMYLGIGLVCLIALLIVLATGISNSHPSTVLTFALIGKSAGLASTVVCQIYTAELYPTAIRNVGIGASSIAARVATLLAPQFVYWSTKSTYGPYLTFSVLASVCIVLVHFLTETRGKPLDDHYDQAGNMPDDTDKATVKPKESTKV